MLSLFYFGFTKVKDQDFYNLPPKTKFTIIVPFRNEAVFISKLLNTLKNLNYPYSHFEVILIDDFSTDNSKQIIEDYLKLHHLNNFSIITNKPNRKSPKKSAIQEGIKHSNFNWIITTDADCMVPNQWLNTYNNIITKDTPDMVCGPVKFDVKHNFLSLFQAIDMISLQTTTIGTFGLNTPFLCNGANIAYKKSEFLKLDGFSGNDSISSGDDTFTLQKFISNKKKIVYLKHLNAIVSTSTQESISTLIHQRMRWASKSGHFNYYGKITGIIVITTNISIFTLGILSIWNTKNLPFFLVVLSLKFLTDYIFINKGNSFFKHQIPFNKFLLSSIFYPIFSTLITVMLPFFNFKWKDRTFNS